MPQWLDVGLPDIAFAKRCNSHNLTLNSCKDPDVKNFKLLKKYLGNLTLTVIYPQNAFRVMVVSNLSPPIKANLGDSTQIWG